MTEAEVLQLLCGQPGVGDLGARISGTWRLDRHRRAAGPAIRLGVILACLRISASAPGGGGPAVWSDTG
ncbi:hypothetical protein E2C06_32740 [Dankookia rubra]|uniref:Uncharacterized protein n=1 Tax=Dankookia rubra TaxID=1442381 RepID=A0A4R5Q7E8_9PROT|nr:hypothetical protein [Dankookia rubra]TDH58419.1 hypothetical protein E2C06_32740 [Dankookia rubra]